MNPRKKIKIFSSSLNLTSQGSSDINFLKLKEVFVLQCINQRQWVSVPAERGYGLRSLCTVGPSLVCDCRGSEHIVLIRPGNSFLSPVGDIFCLNLKKQCYAVLLLCWITTVLCIWSILVTVHRSSLQPQLQFWGLGQGQQQEHTTPNLKFMFEEHWIKMKYVI